VTNQEEQGELYDTPGRRARRSRKLEIRGAAKNHFQDRILFVVVALNVFEVVYKLERG